VWLLIDESDEFFGGEKRHSVAFVSVVYKGKRLSERIIPENLEKESRVQEQGTYVP